MADKKKIHRTSIGGQAVIEGVMMRGPREIAVAVRREDGEIFIDKKPVASIIQKHKLLKIPILRGVVSFIESMVVGVRALTFSAEIFAGEEETTTKEEETSEDVKDVKESKGNDKKSEKEKVGLSDVAIYITVIISFAIGIALFFLLPNILIGFIKERLPSNALANLCEGGVRLGIFLLYLGSVSFMKDVRRVFEYHGAEHKTIHCYESGRELSVENVKKFSRLHPRCGTSFLLIVMVISIIFFTFIPWTNPIERLLYRLALLPVIAGFSYEIIKFAGRHDNLFTRIISAPGMLLQFLTTKEPDGPQIEVAICSLESVLTEDKEEDKW